MQKPVEILTASELKAAASRVGCKFISLDGRTYVLQDGRRFSLSRWHRKDGRNAWTRDN